MQYKTAAFFAVGLASTVTATGWLDQESYSVPGNTDNKCSDKQQGGYDWSGLSEGSFDSYGSNKFSGFSCGNSFGKRDLLTKRTFQSKCIQGNLDESPSIGSDGDDDRFSIDELEISTSEDADVECEYSMPDGSKCRETHSCSSGGNVVKNTQCGGARSVTFKPGKNAPSGCSVGVHSINFDCNSASSSVPAPTPTSSTIGTPGYTSQTAYATSSAACGSGDDSEECSASATPSSPVSSSAPAPSCAYGSDDEGCEGSSSTPATIATPGYTSRTSEAPSSPVSSAPVESCAYGETYGENGCEGTSSAPATTSSAPAVTATPGYTSAQSEVPSAPVSSAPVESCAPGEWYGANGCESSTIGVPGYTQGTSSTENSPVGSSSVPGIPSYGVSTSSVPASAPYPSSSTQATPIYGTGSPSSSTENSPVGSSSAPSYPEPSCPGVLPKCVKTWLHVSDCKDSGDSDCFCKNAQFIKNVHECLPAWASDEEASAAASYLIGLCAPQVPENPGIITNVPSSITPIATPSYTQPASTPAVSAPVSSALESSPVQSSVPVYQPSSSEGTPIESEAPPPAYTPEESSPVESSPVESAPPAYTPEQSGPVESAPPAYTPEQSGPVESAPPAYTPEQSTPYSPVTESSPAESAGTPYSPVTTSPAGSPPEYTAPAGPGSAPGYTAPPAGSAPCTTVTFSSSIAVPATYTEGVSQGYEIPDSSYTTHLVTTITVPQVALTTVTITSDGLEQTSVGLGAGSPAPASATPTADAVGGQPPAGYGTGSAGFGTSYYPQPTASGAPLEQVGNGGSKAGASFAGLALGAVAMVMAF